MRRELMTVCQEYPQPAETLWPIVADLDRYADHVTGLRSSPVISGEGLGAARRCNTVKDKSWSEHVSKWEDGSSYQIEVDTSTYPAPLKQLFRQFTGIWRVTRTEMGCKVCISFVPDVRGGWILWPVVWLGSRQSRRDLKETLDSYGKAASASST